ncbi:MAG: indole-3-glycerol phosphate synthase TrpC [Desulfobacca sp.]|nr:indole-3-glycerol phosphate synthase TrpC [Desulfobacca sp.]
MNFLQRIAARKLEETEKLFTAGRLEDFRQLISQRPAPQSLKAALDQAPVPAIIAEIKKASPSKGMLAADLDPVALAHTYQAHGAAALSVLTERAFFQGSPELLAELRIEVTLPILRKDFILEPIQVYESAALGADALLLIVALLPLGTLRALLLLTRSLGLEALVEVHTKAELDQALEAEAGLIGINHRNLRTFEVDLGRALELAPLIPPEVTVVAASGLKTRDDLKRLEAVGIRAFLIGETLVTAPDPGAKLRELLGQ